jgi:hypothetical protein
MVPFGHHCPFHQCHKLPWFQVERCLTRLLKKQNLEKRKLVSKTVIIVRQFFVIDYKEGWSSIIQSVLGLKCQSSLRFTGRNFFFIWRLRSVSPNNRFSRATSRQILHRQIATQGQSWPWRLRVIWVSFSIGPSFRTSLQCFSLEYRHLSTPGM